MGKNVYPFGTVLRNDRMDITVFYIGIAQKQTPVDELGEIAPVGSILVMRLDSGWADSYGYWPVHKTGWATQVFMDDAEVLE